MSVIRYKRAFTLIELLVVVSLLAVVSLAIYSVLSSGLKVWKKTNTALVAEDIGIFYAKLSQDLSSIIKFNSIPFTGQREKLEFCSIVESPNLAAKNVGKVIYEYDPLQKTFRRGTSDFSQVYKEEVNFQGALLNKVQSLKFTYYFYDQEKKAFLWTDDWIKDSLPAAVRLEMAIGEGPGTVTVTKTLCIPLYRQDDKIKES